jgi:hypothetical protein
MVMKRLSSNSDKGDCGRDALSITYFESKIKPAVERHYEGWGFLKVHYESVI